ncbi:hypothetical protein BASA81_017397 [Batrachochytrium salamandrivorans]|nr:hypothetical protein BASA81_017397 [Batrachochytrium salamandrivorans]
MQLGGLAKPVKDMAESAVSAFLYELMMTYGAPFEIISDRGKSFLAEGIDLFERENRIRHLATTPYHPQTNGRMEENSEFIARNLEEVGQARSAANVRTKAQAEAMRKRNNFDETTPDYFFKVGQVKMKHHDRLKLEFRWKGPYHVVDVGHPGTYWIMTPQGLRLPNAVNQNDLAPWLAPVVDNIDFFYDGTKQEHGSNWRRDIDVSLISITLSEFILLSFPFISLLLFSLLFFFPYDITLDYRITFLKGGVVLRSSVLPPKLLWGIPSFLHAF